MKFVLLATKTHKTYKTFVYPTLNLATARFQTHSKEASPTPAILSHFNHGTNLAKQDTKHKKRYRLPFAYRSPTVRLLFAYRSPSYRLSYWSFEYWITA